MENSTLAPWLLSYPSSTTITSTAVDSNAFQQQQQQRRDQRYRRQHHTSDSSATDTAIPTTTATTTTITTNGAGITTRRLSERRAAATLLQTSAELAVFLTEGVHFSEDDEDGEGGQGQNANTLDDDAFGDDEDDGYAINFPALLGNGLGGGDDYNYGDDNEMLPTLQTVDMLRDRIRGDLSTVRGEIDSLHSWYQQYSERIASAVLAGFFGSTGHGRDGLAYGNSGGADDGARERRAAMASTTRVGGRSGDAEDGRPPPPPPPPQPQPAQPPRADERAIRMTIPIEWADLPDIPLRRFGFSPSSSTASSSAFALRATRRATRRAQQQQQSRDLQQQQQQQQQSQHHSHYTQLLTADGDVWTVEDGSNNYPYYAADNIITNHTHPTSTLCININGGEDHLWTPTLFYDHTNRPACCRAHAAIVLDGLDADGNDVLDEAKADRSFFCNVGDWNIRGGDGAGGQGLMMKMTALQGGEVVGR
ncbi:hypothetical protein HDU86_007666 [Geranomyces michiganensis]|nr:hypothetical protein HDU86_007666 [Geranomyces michiganensis]